MINQRRNTKCTKYSLHKNIGIQTEFPKKSGRNCNMTVMKSLNDIYSNESNRHKLNKKEKERKLRGILLDQIKEKHCTIAP